MYSEPDGISVIICCYNSAGRLPETLAHLAKQNFTGNWEIVLVDNNCTDATTKVARESWAKLAVPGVSLNITEQPRPGLNYAREQGAAVARYKYLILCDDDNWLNDDYLSVAWQIMQNDPATGAAGGECVAVTEPGVVFPDWFEAVKNNYAAGKQAERSGDVTRRGYLWGAGLITTKVVFNKCVNAAYPYLLADRTGKLLSSGGDTELCSRMILVGYKLHYDERLLLQHFIPAERLTLTYFDKLIAGINAAHVQLSKYYQLIALRNLSRGQKIKLAVKSGIKVLLRKIVKPQDSGIDSRALFYLTGIAAGIDNDTKLIKKFADECAKYPS